MGGAWVVLGDVRRAAQEFYKGFGQDHAAMRGVVHIQHAPGTDLDIRREGEAGRRCAALRGDR